MRVPGVFQILFLTSWKPHKDGQHQLYFIGKETEALRGKAISLIHGHHQMVNTEIRLIIFFAAKDGEALYSRQKEDQELTVAQTMNSLLPNSDLN